MHVLMSAPDRRDERCPLCEGYGDIWVGWHPTPVQCGHCHGTGKNPELDAAVAKLATQKKPKT